MNGWKTQTMPRLDPVIDKRNSIESKVGRVVVDCSGNGGSDETSHLLDVQRFLGAKMGPNQQFEVQRLALTATGRRRPQ